VIREELAAGASKERRRKRAAALGEQQDGLDIDGLCERAGIEPARARELEDFGLLEPRLEGGQRIYSEADADIAVACETLSRFGIAPRNLRAFRTTADRQSGLLDAVVAPALRSRNPERRRAGIEDLQAMSDAAHELSQLLFSRNVQKLAAR
jgi:DNA-binding transcriptional MerR regulator